LKITYPFTNYFTFWSSFTYTIFYPI
jgi:hypothetical protein